ncbi:TPA: hypothetical protein ACJG22_001155 [Salmonella enterica subsp. enterica serovar Oranienburg]
MTTITKERLQWLANISGRDDIDDIDGGEIRELARIALASMDAEPAGYHVIRECGKVGCSVATLEEAEKTRDFWNKKWTIRPYFYSAAPAPVVPEDISGIIERFQYQADHLSDWRHIDEHSCKVNRRDLMTALEFMDSCRAAMLQGKFRDLSQPVDPQVTKYEQIMLQAGWVMVPIEPTDEMIAAAMECDDVLFNSDGSFCVQFREIYCAMVDAALALNKGEY